MHSADRVRIYSREGTSYVVTRGRTDAQIRQENETFVQKRNAQPPRAQHTKFELTDYPSGRWCENVSTVTYCICR